MGGGYEITPLEFPEKILEIDTIAKTGMYPIYVSAPPGSEITATHTSEKEYTFTMPSSGMGTLWIEETGEYVLTGTTSTGVTLTSATVIVVEESFTIPIQAVDLTSLETTSTRVGSSGIQATTIEGYAVLIGTRMADALDVHLSRMDCSNMSQNLNYGTVNSFMNQYAIHAGGSGYSSKWKSFNTVESYDTNLTYKQQPSLQSECCYNSSGEIGDYFLVAGGQNTSPSTSVNVAVVNRFEKNFARSTATALSGSVCSLSTSFIPDKYRLFAGGGTLYSSGAAGPSVANVDAYDTKLTKTRATGMSQQKQFPSHDTHTDTHAIFAGGGNSSSLIVEAWSETLTKSTLAPLSVSSGQLAGTYLNGNALLFGVDNGKEINIYNSDLTKLDPIYPEINRYAPGATTLEEYAIVVGGGQANFEVYSM